MAEKVKAVKKTATAKTKKTAVAKTKKTTAPKMKKIAAVKTKKAATAKPVKATATKAKKAVTTKPVKATATKAKKAAAPKAKKVTPAKTKKVKALGKLLVSIDSSEASQKAIDYLVNMGPLLKSYEITLCHALPTIPPKMLEDGGSEDPIIERSLKAERDEEIGSWEGRLKARIRKVFDKYKKELVASGIPAGKVKTKVLGRSLDVGKALINAAKKDGFSTIVVGRRGVSFLQELALGSVSYRVVKLAKDCTVWVVH